MPNSNAELIKHLKNIQSLKTEPVITAFLTIDRKNFVLPKYLSAAYYDGPLEIGYGQTISQPTTVAIMLELLDVEAGNKILDIGCGSGWTTALLTHLTGSEGAVFGTEIIPELVEFGNLNLQKIGITDSKITPAGSKLGLTGQTFDRILVSASARHFPQELLNQLNPGGKIVIPINTALHIYTKTSKNQISEQIMEGFMFVPLII